ncbi:MAG: hypothetical protein C0514_06110 [Candidatus Puniceispirillum sp.]|nr:hypothetical protein [Candidatus Puniceispirillum sp.]
MTVMFIVCWVGRAYGCDPQDVPLVPVSAHTAPGPSALDLLARVGMVDPAILEDLSKRAKEAHKAALAHMEGGLSIQEQFQQLLVTIDDLPSRAPLWSGPVPLWTGYEGRPRGLDEHLNPFEVQVEQILEQVREITCDARQSTPCAPGYQYILTQMDHTRGQSLSFADMSVPLLSRVKSQAHGSDPHALPHGDA